MSGFIVQVAVHGARKDLTGPLDLMAHRGLDDRGVWIQGDHTFFMGHRRSSHFDSGRPARQPLSDPFSSLHLVFDGEIYNWKELRKELEAEGHSFASDSDTEVVMAAYRRWGKACLKKLNGPFAFVVWDDYQNVIFAARDALGMRPLYYHEPEGWGITLGSEIKALHASGIMKAANRNTWSSYLLHGESDSGENCFWDHIKQLAPGTCLTWSFSKGALRERWYDLPEVLTAAGQDDRSDDEVQEDFLFRFREGLDNRFRSEGQVGMVLHGDLQSALQLGLLHRARGRDAQVTMLSLGSPEEGLDDLSAVSRMLENTTHPFLSPDFQAEYFPDMADALVYFQDEPFDLLPSVVLAAEQFHARNAGLSVVLRPEGLSKLWSSGVGGGPDQVVPEQPKWLSAEMFKHAVTAGSISGKDERSRAFAGFARFLRGSDRVAAAYSMSNRFLFLDMGLLELALRQPENRRNPKASHWVPGRIARMLLPQGIPPPRKVSIPEIENRWLCGPLAEWTERWIREALAGYGEAWLDKDGLLQAWETCKTRGWDGQLPVGRIVNLGMFGKKSFFMKA